MISKEKYEEVLASLSEKMQDCSDAVAITALPYEDFLTSKGDINMKKNGFSVKIEVSYFNIRARRFVKIMTDTFSRLDTWMDDFEDIHFYSSKSQPISGTTARFEFEVKFDDVTDAAKRLLMK
jgi:hypothetical protein